MNGVVIMLTFESTKIPKLTHYRQFDVRCKNTGQGKDTYDHLAAYTLNNYEGCLSQEAIRVET